MRLSSEMIIDAFGHIDDALIEQAYFSSPKQTRAVAARTWKVALCAGLALVLVAAAVIWSFSLPITMPPRTTTAQITPGLIDPEGIMDYKALLVHYTEEEMFAMEDLVIVRGHVTALQNYTVDFNGSKWSVCVATVMVERVYQGKVKEAQTIDMLLPCAIGEGLKMEDTGVISQIRIGMEGIFMPRMYDNSSYHEEKGDVLMLKDLAPCGLGDGMRWAFLATERGIAYAKYSYPGAGAPKTLDDIESYILRMIK